MTDSLCIDIVADSPFDVEYIAPAVDVVIPEPVAGVLVVDQAGPPGPPPEPQAIANAVSDYLTTNPVLPPQAGQAGNVLSTNGAEPAWTDITPPVTLTLLLDNALV